jgi:hypothetical protein
MSIRCWHCKDRHETVAEVRACSEGAPTHADPRKIPDGRYAVQGGAGLHFYAIRQGGPSKTGYGKDWTGFTFVDELFGSPGTFSYQPVRDRGKKQNIYDVVAADTEGAARLFGQKYRCCGHCLSPLTKAQSRAAGYGEKCASNHGYWYPSKAEALQLLGETEEEAAKMEEQLKLELGR